MRRIAITLAASAFLLSSLGGLAAFAHGNGGSGHAGFSALRVHPVPTYQSSAPRGPVALARKIRTPRQCFHACLKLSGASIDFCAVSCY